MRNHSRISWPVLAFVFLPGLFLPGLVLAEDGIWLGFAEPDDGATGDCESADAVVLIDGSDVRGGLFAYDPIADEIIESVIAGTLNPNGTITNGTVTEFDTQTVITTYSGAINGTNISVEWQDTENQNCFGTAALTQQASFADGFEEKWLGTAAESQNLPNCPGADPIGDVTIVVSAGNDVDGAIEITQAGEAPVTFSISGSLNASRVLQNGTVGTTGTTLASLTGTFGAQNTTLNWDDGECTGTVTLALQTQNTPPSASPLAFEVVAGEAFSGTLPAQDPDAGTALTYSIVTQPAKGTVTISNTATGAFSYTANADASGIDTFEFKVNDGIDDSNVATVTATITPAQTTPIEALLLILGGDEEEEPQP